MRIAVLLLLLLCTRATAETPLRSELEALGFVAGSCWEGQFDSDGQTDTHCFSPVFDGMHIRDVHAVIGGETVYRGETIYSWDDATESINFVYWNSIGGVSRGRVDTSSIGIAFPDETYVGADGRQIAVETYWLPDGPDAYESLVIQRFDDNTTQEHRVRYERILPGALQNLVCPP